MKIDKHRSFEPGEKKGKFIVIYGANNIGKSTQVQMLASRLLDKGKQILVLKYPVYSLKPTGPRINAILRHGAKMDEESFQKLYAQNRKDFQPILLSILRAGIYVLAEDYVGTGIAWGMVRGLSKAKLIKINNGLLEPDLCILMDGKRFKTHIEKGHINEDITDALWKKSRDVHRELGKTFGWKIVRANHSRTHLHEKIWHLVSRHLSLEG